MCTPIRTRTVAPCGQSCSARARCASIGGPDGVRGTLEGEEECVPLSVDLDAVMPFDGLAHQAAMQAQDRPVLLPKPP